MNAFFTSLPKGALEGLNVFFFIFHTLFTLFNLTGWIWKKTRPAHAVTMVLTSFSWFILGLFYGIGFCFCTEWHWQVRRLLGIRDTSTSYIYLLIKVLTGKNLSEPLVIEGTKWVFIGIVIATVIVWIPEIRKRLKKL